MKKFYIKDGVQILLAIVFTGSAAYAMQPVSQPAEPQNKAVAAVETQKVDNDAPRTETPATQPETKPEPPKTWQDNPNNCNQDTQYIAAEEPFECIDKPQSVPTASAAPAAAQSVSTSGSCEDWIARAGITDLGNARELIRRESGCNPNAVNPSSGACGVAQELPCGKSGCSLGDGACQVAWMNRYVQGRYGSWANAVAFHNANNWY